MKIDPRRCALGWALTLMFCAAMFCAAWSASAQPSTPCDPFVPEANRFSLVYSLDIPRDADYGDALPPYSVDNAGSIGEFDRVAYCMRLDDEWIWVSMDAFTAVPTRVGVPVISTGAVFQETLSNMNVFSNAPGIVGGTGIETGNIEFWHHCYWQTNEIAIPGADDAVYDFGDDNRREESCYGSMQVHDYGAAQTLFAYNQWDYMDPSDDDLGIGNSPSRHPDWTFEDNTGSYDVRTLDVLVQLVPEMTIVGDCPGEVTITVSGMTEDATAALLASPSEGSSVVPAGRPCEGTPLGLESPRLLATFNTGPLGTNTTFDRVLPAERCGAFMQVVDLGACNTTSVEQLP